MANADEVIFHVEFRQLAIARADGVINVAMLLEHLVFPLLRTGSGDRRGNAHGAQHVGFEQHHLLFEKIIFAGSGDLHMEFEVGFERPFASAKRDLSAFCFSPSVTLRASPAFLYA